MTAEQVAQVRERLAEVRALAEAATPGPWKTWGMEVRADPVGDSNLDTSLPVARTTHEAGLRTFNCDLIAAMSPDVVLRLVEWAEDVLDRHPAGQDYGWCHVCSAVDWPCSDVLAVIKAWAP